MMRKKLWMIVVIVLVFIIALEIGIKVGNKKNNDEGAVSWQEQYDLGVRYLSEGNYEEAIIAFTAAIEIDPREQDAYLKLADAYVGIDNIDEAVVVLHDGFNYCDDKSEILEMLETVSPETTYGIRIRSLFENEYQGNGISFEDVSFLGNSIIDLDIMEMEYILQNSGFSIRTADDIGLEEDDLYYVCGNTHPHGPSPYITVEQRFTSACADFWEYHDNGYDDYVDTPLDIGLCNIYTYESIETVLTKLGFVNASEIVALLHELDDVTDPTIHSENIEDSRASFFCEEKSFDISIQPRGANHSMVFRITVYRDSNRNVSLPYNVLCIDFSFEEDRLELVFFQWCKDVTGVNVNEKFTAE